MRQRIHELWLALEVPKGDEMMIENAYLVAMGCIDSNRWDEAGELLEEIAKYQYTRYLGKAIGPRQRKTAIESGGRFNSGLVRIWTWISRNAR
jgi:hypothetical protein